MSTLAVALREPIALATNRTPRFYRGGRLLGAFRGDPGATDDDRPEDWVGSATRAWTRSGEPRSPIGLSEVDVAGERMTLEQILAREPDALVGRGLAARIGSSLGLLVKLLDAAERLPVHCHPTRDAATRLLGSRFGKTEAWIILGTREEAQAGIWAGFREATSPATLREWIDEQRTDELLDSLVHHPVRAGDAFLIPAGTPHAIGAGVFLLELQEPTDFSIVAETRGYPIEPADASLRLGWETAIELFDTSAAADLRQSPVEVSDGVTRLLGGGADPYFRALRLTASGERPLPIEPTLAIGVVLGGSGALRGQRTTLPLARGVTFAVPSAAVAGCVVSGESLDVVLCLPPDPAALDADALPLFGQEKT